MYTIVISKSLLRRVSVFFLALSLVFFLFPFFYTFVVDNNFFTSHTLQPIVISNALTKKQKKGEVPQRIVIPSVGINLSIVPAKVVDGYWELSTTTASYGLGSGLPGEKGNTVIFAHAREGLFLPLQNVTIADKVIVTTKHHTFTYKVTKITQVYPSDVSVISPTKDETITLFTCTGFMDAKRLIVIAKPIT